MPKTDVIALLKKDHAHVKALLTELANTTERAAKKREKLLDQVIQEIQIHSKIEEEIFYPAFHEAIESKEKEKLYFEALEEHHVVDLVIPEIQECDVSSEEFGAKAKVLKDLIEHHAGEEEDEMFPAARKVLSAEELQELGARCAERKEQLASAHASR